MEKRHVNFVTVVLSVRNASPWITEQLIAIADQALSIPFDIVVADGGSTDDTVERCQALIDLGKAISLIDASERRGKQFGQRLGVHGAQGDLIAFADGDDVAAPGWLQALVDASSDFDMVGGPFDIQSLNHPDVIASRPYVSRRVSGLTEALGSGFLYAAGANCAIWRSRFLQIDAPDNDLPPEAAAAEDLDLMFRLRRAGGTVGFAPGAVMAYRLRREGKALRLQMRGYGVGDALVAKRYRALGAHGDSLPVAIRRWAFLAPRALKARVMHDDWHWARSDFAFAVGRLKGSIRFRVMCF